LPKLVVPTTSARSWSCSAPATISLAEALPPSVSTTIGGCVTSRSPDARATSSAALRERTFTIDCPPLRNSELTASD
jgi:hypothetical protein